MSLSLLDISDCLDRFYDYFNGLLLDWREHIFGLFIFLRDFSVVYYDLRLMKATKMLVTAMACTYLCFSDLARLPKVLNSNRD